MELISEICFMSILPIANLLLLFLKDDKEERKITTIILILSNVVIFWGPYIYNIPNAYEGKSVLFDGHGGGLYLIYFLLIPICFVLTVILAVLRIIAHKEHKQNKTEK